MARISRFVALPWLGLAAACATGVDPAETDADSGGGQSGGSQSSITGGSSSQGGQAFDRAGQAAGGQSHAFGGTAGTAGASAGAGSSGAAHGGSGGTADGGTSSGGSTAGGTGGMASGGTTTGGTTGGSNGGGAGAGGSGGASAGSGGAGGASGGGGAGGNGGAGGGNCAPENSGWVVQYWTTSAPSDMPSADLRILNNGGGTVNFSALELRHYFTNEETATLSFVFVTLGHSFPGPPYYEDENGANVLSSIVSVTPPRPNATEYISIQFNDKPGNFAPGEWAQLGFYSSLSIYPKKSNQANDYTYMGHPTADPGSDNETTGWSRITLYVGGQLVWGCEP